MRIDPNIARIRDALPANAREAAALRPRPKGMPDVATWAAELGITVIREDSRPWMPPAHNEFSVEATEHLWLLLLPGSRLPALRDRAERAEAILLHTAALTGEDKRKSLLRAEAVYCERLGRGPGKYSDDAMVRAMAAPKAADHFTVMGWLEV